MNNQRMIWHTCIAVAVSTAVSVTATCFMVPVVVDKLAADRAHAEPTESINAFAQSELPPTAAQPKIIDHEQDREEIDAIKKKLGINVFSGTLFNDKLAEETPDQQNADSAAQTPEQIATQALESTAKQLQADGQTAAAQLVQAAAAELQKSSASAANTDRSKRTR